MKGEVSSNALTILFVILVAVSLVGASMVYISISDGTSVALTEDPNKATVGLNVGEPPEPTAVTGQVGLVVAT